MAAEHISTREPRSERLEARASPERKRLLQRAAALAGQTLSDFLVGSASKEAEAVIRRHEIMTLSERDSRAFVEALLSSEPPGPRLRQAAARYRAVMGDQ